MDSLKTTCPKTITVFIPAFNEAENIQGAVESALKAVHHCSIDYEIIILNACSTDRTGEIAEFISAENEKIKVVHRRVWSGLGANYMVAASHATKEFFVMFPGDNENSWQSLAMALEKIGESDIVIPYTKNTEVRAFHRRLISKAFVLFLNIIFNLKLRYYNGTAVYKTKVLQKLKINSQDFAYNAEILIKLIKSGYSYSEIGIEIKPTTKTAIFNINNVIGVLKTICRLIYDVKIKERKLYQA